MATIPVYPADAVPPKEEIKQEKADVEPPPLRQSRSTGKAKIADTAADVKSQSSHAAVTMPNDPLADFYKSRPIYQAGSDKQQDEQAIDFSDEHLYELITRKRSGKHTLDDPSCIAYVKLCTRDTAIKSTQRNENCSRSTWIHKKSDKKWYKIGDREDIYAYHAPENFDHAVIAVHLENYVHPQSYYAELESDEEEVLYLMTDEESLLIKAKRGLNARQKSLLRVCRTLALPLLLIALISQRILARAGLSVNAPPIMSQIQCTDIDCGMLYKFDHANNMSQNDPFCS